jgi:hypothetical protein
MIDSLPPTGTAALLEKISPWIPDDFIEELLPPHRGRGRRSRWSSSQLFRLLLLALLTPAHSYNLLVNLLPEQRAWRRFAKLRNPGCVPTASILHEFRSRLGVASLRQNNRQLLLPLLKGLRTEKAIGLIDSTDLPAATSGFKKS